MAEEWRAIDEWPYEVSDEGRVRRSAPGPRTRVGRVRKLATDNYGYKTVLLSKSSWDTGQITKTFTVHKLVASAFIGPRPAGLQINHRDGDKSNNSLGNLEYVTPLENTRHAAGKGLRAPQYGANNPAARLNRRAVLDIRRRREAGETLKALADEYGVTIGCICNVAKRRTWKHIK